MKPNIKFRLLAVAAFVMSAVQVSFVSCSDDPGVENYFTSTAEYASDFLKNREKFSDFTAIVQRSKMMDLLGTYGSYTVFAPTNEAIQKYLQGRGLTSIDQLSQQDCDTITFTHIIEQAFFTTDFNDGTYPTMNMLERPLTITCDSDTVSVPGEIQLAVYINKEARMIQMDDSVENGVVHTMNSVIGAKNAMLPDVLAEDSTITLFYMALDATHMKDSLQRYIDETYTVGSDSIDWTNDKLCIHTAVEYDNVAYPEHRYFKYTALVPRDDVFAQYGVTDLEGLIKLAHRLYDPIYPEDAANDDLTSRDNALNRFISYHLLPCQMTYYQFTAVDGPNSSLANGFNRRRWDIADWYETMLPFGVIKASFPSGTESGLYINRRGVQSRRDSRGYRIRGARILPASEVNVDQTAVNGVYHYIDDILSYGVTLEESPWPTNRNHNVQADVFSERMRIDCSTLSPDFITSGARGHYTESSVQNGKYAVQSTSAKAATNRSTLCLGFKAGYAKNWSYTDATHVHVRPRYLSFWSYQGDEVTVKGRFNVAITLPAVPAGEWEIRMFTCIGFDSRGIVQYYINKQPQGIPFDMRPGGENAKVGWRSDTSLGEEEQIAAFDKQFHYRGWMKGMDTYGSTAQDGTGSLGATFRSQNNTLRKVIGTFHSDGKTHAILRLEQKMESEDNEMNFDCIELCPSAVYANPDVAEDRL